MNRIRLFLLSALFGLQLPLQAETLAPLGPEDELSVSGRHIVNRRGETVVLGGVNIASLEWLPGGEHIRASFRAAVEDWRAKIIRLPVRSSFWFGFETKAALPVGFSEAAALPPAQRQRADAYRTLVDELIAYANERGVYVLIDLHEFKAPTAEHLAFWRDCARRYANRPGVLYDLLNEPHSISWEEWRDGGKLSGAERADAVAENQEAAELTTSVGMQKCVDTVRATGARNLVVAGGLDWAYDLSGIAEGFELRDPDGNGIVYATHIYPWKTNWKEKVLCIADRFPILVGEVGCMDKTMPFESKLVDPYAWAPDVLAFLQANNFSWCAWCFHPAASPCILADWSYTPTPYWGAFVRAALRGARFTSSTLR